MLQVVRKNLTDQINLKPTSLHTVVSSPTDALYVEKTLPGDLTLKNMNEVSNNIVLQLKKRERCGSVVECLTLDQEAAGSSLTGVAALWSLSKNIYPSLVLVQLRKTRPFITKKLLMGR